MKSVGIIPARYASTRFPGKPLALICGVPMIELVYRQVMKSQLDEVVVATDNQQIYDCVEAFGGQAVMTSENHENGTSRCEEAISLLDSPFDVVVNIQGDEPFIEPAQINQVIDLLNEGAQIATLVKLIEDNETLFDLNKPKVVFSDTYNALYFSRQTIPFLRDKPKEEWLGTTAFYKHIGIYGFHTDVLDKIVKLPVGKLENLEKLEQLRWLENGLEVRVGKTIFETIGIDTPEDLKEAEKNYSSN